MGYLKGVRMVKYTGKCSGVLKPLLFFKRVKIAETLFKLDLFHGALYSRVRFSNIEQNLL